MSWLAKAGDWLDERTGYRALVHHALDEPVPGGARWAYVLGSVLIGCITLQAITGWALMAYYAPSATTAWASVEHITYGVSGGWLVRGMHHFGAQAMVVCLVLHLAQVAIFGAYKAPREVNWWFGSGCSASRSASASPATSCPGTKRATGPRASPPTSRAPSPSSASRSSSSCRAAPSTAASRSPASYTLHVAILPALLVGLLGRARAALPQARRDAAAQSADLTKVDKFYPAAARQGRGAACCSFWSSWSRSTCASTALRSMRPPILRATTPRARSGTSSRSFRCSSTSTGRSRCGIDPDPRRRGRLPRASSVLGQGAEHRARPAPQVPLAPRGDGDRCRGAYVPVDALRRARRAVSESARSGQRARRAGDRARQEGHSPRRPSRHAAARSRTARRGPLSGALRELPPARRHGPDSREGHRARSRTDGVRRSGRCRCSSIPTLPHRFGQTSYKGEMLSVVQPLRRRASPRRLPKPNAKKGHAAPDAASAIFKPMPDADRNAIVAFLAGEAAEVKDASTTRRARSSSASAARSAICSAVRPTTTTARARARRMGEPRLDQAQIANPSSNATYRKYAFDPDNKGHMPRFDDKLEADDIACSPAWVRKKARGGK